MIEINFTDEKTKRHYLIIVDLLMNLFMSGFTIDLIKNEKRLKSNIQLSDLFNFDIRPYCRFTLIIKENEEEIGYIDLEFDYGCLLNETFIINGYSSNLAEITNATDKFSNYLNNF